MISHSGDERWQKREVICWYKNRIKTSSLIIEDFSTIQDTFKLSWDCSRREIESVKKPKQQVIEFYFCSVIIFHSDCDLCWKQDNLNFSASEYKILQFAMVSSSHNNDPAGHVLTTNTEYSTDSSKFPCQKLSFWNLKKKNPA